MLKCSRMKTSQRIKMAGRLLDDIIRQICKTVMKTTHNEIYDW